jgi:hypothetical protein
MTMTSLIDPSTTHTPDAAEELRRHAAAVRVAFTWWGTHRTLTAQQKEEVCEAYGADAKLLSAGKRIIDVRHESYRALTATRSRIVGFWRALTLPYVEPGVRLIKQADIPYFTERMEALREDLREAEKGLDRVYDAIRADARERLGRLYNAADYPEQITGLFAVDWEFPAVEPPSYLARIAPEVYSRERDRVARRFEEAVQLAQSAFTAEFSKLVTHLTERLRDGPQGERQVFRDSVVGNLRDFFERFRRLNVGSSEELDQLVRQAQDLVEGVTPQQLRDSESMRHHIATEMSVVQSQLNGLIIDRPRRNIIRSGGGSRS